MLITDVEKVQVLKLFQSFSTESWSRKSDVSKTTSLVLMHAALVFLPLFDIIRKMCFN